MTVRTTLPAAGLHTGPEVLANSEQHFDRFWNISTIPLTSVGGTGDVVTATIDPITNVGLVAGMKFTFKATANNTGAVTLKIGAEAAKPIVTAANVALASGAVLSGTTYILHYDGTSFLILSVPGESLRGAVLTYTVLTANGTLTKPTNFPDDGVVVIEAWGGGGGGNGSTAGGGGGAFSRQIFRGADLGSTETVTMGLGGAADTAGGNTSVGTLVLAFGGGKTGGGGGGQISAGQSGIGGGKGGSPFGGAGGNGDDGADGNAGGGGTTKHGGDGINGGGGGGSSGKDGGDSLFGGGGGGGSSGGTSVYGGNGGADGVGGVIPGGGGGTSNSAGARGEVRVRWIG